MRLKVIFAGTPQNAASTLRALVKAGIEIVGVLTRADAPVGRKKVFEQSPVALEAQALGLTVIKANSIGDYEIDQITSLNADLGLIVAYGAFLDQQALSCLDRGWINLHYSLLPKYRGAAPVQWALLNGEQETGVSVFQLELGMDTGPTFISVPTKIEAGENAQRLLDRLTNLGVSALLEILPSIAAGIAKPTQQLDENKSFAPKISRADAEIDWNSSAKKIESLINAMNPEPAAWSTINGVALRVLSGRETKVVETNIPVGHVVFDKESVVVGCYGSHLLLQQVQPSGKSPMTAADWMRGHRGKDPVVLGT
jgi:methionyl-tRNA formyltransferase